MSQRLRNNLFAGVIVIAFWCISFSAMAADPIVTDATSKSTVTTNANSKSTIRSNPPSAISPSVNNANSDGCVVSASGAASTSVIGISGSKNSRDYNCELIKLSRELRVNNMKIASISVLCLDYRVWKAMSASRSNTPCPHSGKIGSEAAALWAQNPQDIPIQENIKPMNSSAFYEKLANGLIGALLLGILAK